MVGMAMAVCPIEQLGQEGGVAAVQRRVHRAVFSGVWAGNCPARSGSVATMGAKADSGTAACEVCAPCRADRLQLGQDNSMTTAPLSSPCAPSDGWDPAQTGHALFRTRLGICGIAWGAQAVVALRLPEPSLEGTQMRLLEHARQRRSGLWPQAQAVDALSAQALQAVAGVQWLLAGRHAAGGLAGSDAWPDAPAPVLGDLRALFTLRRRSEHSGLPLLDDVVLDWHGVPDFSRAVYQLALAIEPGQTRSYGALAQDLGGKGLARAVGQALGANPFAPVVPCHRILAAQGAGGGFSANGGTRTKLQLLEWEGAPLGDGGSLGLFD